MEYIIKNYIEFLIGIAVVFLFSNWNLSIYKRNLKKNVLHYFFQIIIVGILIGFIKYFGKPATIFTTMAITSFILEVIYVLWRSFQKKV
jgi:hypothetical protein